MATGDETEAGRQPVPPPRRPRNDGDADLTRQVPSIADSLPPVDPGVFSGEPPPESFGSDSLADQFFSNDPNPAGSSAGRGQARPQILAPQANEWADNRQEVEVVKGSRRGLVLLFLLAMLVVAVIALGLAALSVLRGGDDPVLTAGAGTEQTAAEDSTDDATGGAPADDATPEQTTVPDPTQLSVVLTEEPFICDGGTREFGQLSGAAPNEEVAFSSPQSPGLVPGMADGDGVLPIRWQCDPEQAGTTWELTATGSTSGKSVTFIFAGAALPETATTVAPTSLEIDLVENPFRCDGTARVFGGLSGAEPGEEIAFTSPQATGITSGTADADGNLAIRWQCEADRAGTTWEVTATGVTSGRAVTFSFTGA